MLPLGLSMLWESADPQTALRERFGFSDVGAVSDWVAAQLDETWEIAAHECPRLVISGNNAIAWVDSDRGPLVVKWSRERERFERLAGTTRLIRTLAEHGVPVAAPFRTVSGLDRAVLEAPAGAVSVTVLPEVSGDWLDVEDDAAVRSAGACLARVHQAFGSDGRGGLDSPAPAEALGDQVARWLASEDPGLAPEASRRLGVLLPGLPVLEDVPQLVHNDYRAANILTRDSRVVGVLDLDEVVVGHRVNDLAKASVYLGTRFRAWRPTSAAVRQLLRSGYESVRALSPQEDRWFDVLVLWQGLMAIPGEDDPAGWAEAV